MKRTKGMILGLFFVFLGLAIILKIFLKIDIPVVKTVFALFLVYLGIKILLGNFGINFCSGQKWKEDGPAVFSESDFKDTGQGNHKEYNIVFGKGTADLTAVPLDKEDAFVEVNTVFGSATVIVDPSTPVKIHSNSVFAESSMPDESMVAFGTLNYKSPGTQSGKGHILNIQTNVVFGNLKIRTKP